MTFISSLMFMISIPPFLGLAVINNPGLTKQNGLEIFVIGPNN